MYFLVIQLLNKSIKPVLENSEFREQKKFSDECELNTRPMDIWKLQSTALPTELSSVVRYGVN